MRLSSALLLLFALLAPLVLARGPLPSLSAALPVDGWAARARVAAAAALDARALSGRTGTPASMAAGARRLLSTEAEQEEAQNAASDVIVRFKRSVGRRNFKFEKVSKEFAPYDQDYRESMIMLALPGFVISFSSLVVAILFCCLRKYDKCGGRHPQASGYAAWSRLLFKVLALVLLVACAGAAALGYVGNSQFSAGLNEFFEKLVNAVSQEVATSTDIASDLARLSEQTGANNGTDFQALLDAATKSEEVTLASRDFVLKYDLWRLVLINIGFAFSLLVGLLLFLGALCGSAGCSMGSAYLGFFTLFGLWFSFGVHLPTSIMLADLCPAIDDFVASEDATENEAMATWVTCFQNSSVSESYELASDGVVSMIGEVNRAQAEFDINLPVTINSTIAIEDQLLTFDLRMLEIEDELWILLDDYAIEDSAPVSLWIDYYRRYASVLRSVVRLESCEIPKEAFEELKLVLCLDMLEGLDFILGATGAIGCLLLVSVFVAIKGSKRFPSENKKRPVLPHTRTSTGAAAGGAAAGAGTVAGAGAAYQIQEAARPGAEMAAFVGKQPLPPVGRAAAAPPQRPATNGFAQIGQEETPSKRRGNKVAPK